jgi:hypothetical protein
MDSPRASDGLDELQMLAVNAVGDESFLSEPLRLIPPWAEVTVKPGPAGLVREQTGYTGAGYLPLTRDRNLAVTLPVRVPRDGTYAVDARYANGNGPVNTEDKVAVRTLIVDGDTVGVLVMPQRGTNRWSDWGWTNALRVPLEAGPHVLTLAYTRLDANMNQRGESAALLDQLRLSRLASEPTAPSRR